VKVNVVTVQSGWILQQIARRIVDAGNAAGLGQFTLTHGPGREDVNFYCDISNCYWGKTSTKDIGLFTHVHADDIQTVRPVVASLDHIFHMAERYQFLFAESKFYPLSKMSIMRPWETPDALVFRKPRIGIFQRGKYEGKGYDFMLRLFDFEVARDFRWHFIGNDWEGVIDKAHANDIECLYYKDSEISYPTEYNIVYDLVDYVLIPSKWEGGPISFLEALAKGIRVIAPDVGWVYELTYGRDLVDFFKTGSVEDLATLLEGMVSSKKIGREIVNALSYEQCARQIVEVATRL
jgi:glycosyltransferase involved in cell wall biosynthesis